MLFHCTGLFIVDASLNIYLPTPYLSFDREWIYQSGPIIDAAVAHAQGPSQENEAKPRGLSSDSSVSTWPNSSRLNPKQRPREKPSLWSLDARVSIGIVSRIQYPTSMAPCCPASEQQPPWPGGSQCTLSGLFFPSCHLLQLPTE